MPVVSDLKNWLLEGNRPYLLIIGVISIWVLLYPAIDYIQSHKSIHGDPAQYFAYLQSVFEDGDIQFGDDYLELDPETPVQHYQKLQTGYAPQMFAVGAPLLWSPFYLAGKAYIAFQKMEGRQHELTMLLRFTRFGSRVYAVLALYLIFFILRRFFTARVSLFGTLAVFFCTPLYFYSIYDVLDSHAAGAFSIALFLWYALRTGPQRKPWQWIVLGILLGLVALVRWQDAIIAIWLLVEQWHIFWKSVREGKGFLKLVRDYSLFTLFSLSVFSIQVAIWTVIYGLFKTPLAYGANHVIWDRPEVINLLFSSRHGLFSWHPLTYIAVIALLVWAVVERKGIAVASSLVFLIMLYMNSITGDWWAGDSFGMRRFVSLAPVFALGAAYLGHFLLKSKRHVSAVIAWLLIAVLAIWNVWLVQLFNDLAIPHDEATGMGKLLGPGLGDLVDATIWPFSFPGNLIQSLQTDMASFKDADWICAKQIRSLQNSLEGDIHPEFPSFRNGFSEPIEFEGVLCRKLKDSGNIYFGVITEQPRSALAVTAKLDADNLKGWEIPVVEVILNGNVLKPLVGVDESGNLKRNETLIPIPTWKFGINKLEMRLWIGRKAREGKYRQRKHTFEKDDSLEPAKGRYTLLVEEIKIEDFIKSSAEEY
jgi:hypothetical protein